MRRGEREERREGGKKRGRRGEREERREGGKERGRRGEREKRREGGEERGRRGEREERREGGKERGREGEREERRAGGKERGREGEREGRREGGKEREPWPPRPSKATQPFTGCNAPRTLTKPQNVACPQTSSEVKASRFKTLSLQIAIERAFEWDLNLMTSQDSLKAGLPSGWGVNNNNNNNKKNKNNNKALLLHTTTPPTPLKHSGHKGIEGDDSNVEKSG